MTYCLVPVFGLNLFAGPPPTCPQVTCQAVDIYESPWLAVYAELSSPCAFAFASLSLVVSPTLPTTCH